MRQAALLHIAALSCLCAGCGSPQNPAQGSGMKHGAASMLCTSDENLEVVRLSAVFTVKNPQDFSEPWRIEFRRYLGQSGNESGVLVTCSPVAGDGASALKQRVAALRGKNKQVIETHWAYAN
jgi:hypothetical protein